ncbi:hypothetical protein EV199_4703 [Pseudobacter ginsenosidimutans]|uniref:Uncharacterized protein n=1 Tax=Pseudobacter ginsenosidimutans TaxID=661488 RepID=A0A4Q7MQ72_9BACT|nr:hypothetical protein EV199_4703 [Pseudobacter ginsenosidimutans]
MAAYFAENKSFTRFSYLIGRLLTANLIPNSRFYCLFFSFLSPGHHKKDLQKKIRHSTNFRKNRKINHFSTYFIGTAAPAAP